MYQATENTELSFHKLCASVAMPFIKPRINKKEQGYTRMTQMNTDTGVKIRAIRVKPFVTWADQHN